MATYIERKPDLMLADLVKCYWYLEKDYSIDPNEIILPDGCVDLIIHFGCQFQDTPSTGFLIGQLQEPLALVSTGITRTFGIRFYPYGVYPFVPVPLHEFTGQQIAVDDFLETDMIADKLAFLPPEQAFITLENLLMQLLDVNRLDFEPIKAAAQILYRQHGTLSISALADYVNLSKRSLERKFAEIIGFSPKFLARVMRFNRLKNELMLNPQTNLTTLTYRYNFYDQAHFIHEFKQFTGDSPSIFKEKVCTGQIYFYK